MDNLPFIGRARAHAHPVLACALRMLLTFALAFSFTLGAQSAYANAAARGDARAGGGETAPVAVQEGDPGAPSSSSSSSPDAGEPSQPSEPPAPESPVVTDLGIYIKPVSVGDYINVLSTALAPVNPPGQHQVISSRGGQIDFDAVAYWNDYSENYDFSHVKWSLDPGNESIAVIAPDTGLLTANGTVNGTVVVTATLDEGYGQDGKRWQAKVAVDVVGQDLAPFVTGIVLCDESSVPIEPSYTFMDESLGTAMIEIQARVSVHDPASGADAVYMVKPGAGLSSQTGGAVADLSWWVMIPEMGSVSDDGIYRPVREGQNIVYASGVGEFGATVEGRAAIIFPGEGEAHPQDSLTVDVVWSEYPDRVVATKTFSVADLEALGTITQSYTAIGGRGAGFKSYTGRGPLLVDVLKAAGVDADQLDELSATHPADPPVLRFDSIDNPAERSWSQLVGSDRYYFPNAQWGDYGGARQVAPMLAIESAYAGDGNSEEVPEKMTSDERFRLLYGGTGPGDSNTEFQRKWVNAIHVTLPGAPPAEMPGEDKQDQSEEEKEKEKEQEKPREEGIGGGMNTAGGGGSDAGSPTSSGGSGNDGGAAKSNPGAWSVLSAVNKNASDVAGLDLDNPLLPLTASTCAGMFAAGGVEALGRWRWQKRKPALGLASA